MDREQLAAVCARVLVSPDKDARVIALALQRFLVGAARVKTFDKRAYQRRYMAEYRAGKLRRGKRRRKKR